MPSSGYAPGGAAKARSGRQTVSRRATLASIAAKAGVSTPTVSKVVNGRPDVAPSTRLLVERLLDEHYYLRQALGVYEAARKRGLRLPEDLSVVGFDDLALSRWLPPPLTTVRQAITEIGRVAAQMLGQLTASGPLTSTRVELSTELIIRESAGPAPVVW